MGWHNGASMVGKGSELHGSPQLTKEGAGWCIAGFALVKAAALLRARVVRATSTYRSENGLVSQTVA